MFYLIHGGKHDWSNHIKTLYTFCVICFIFVFFLQYIYIDASTGTTTFYLANACSVSIFPIMYDHI